MFFFISRSSIGILKILQYIKKIDVKLKLNFSFVLSPFSLDLPHLL